MKTTQNNCKREQETLKALLEEAKETRAERKQLKAHYKQRRDTVAAGATWSIPWLEREGIRPLERRESAEAAKKQDEKRCMDNAKEKRKKKAEAAQAEEQELDSKQRCLVEGGGETPRGADFRFRSSSDCSTNYGGGRGGKADGDD